MGLAIVLPRAAKSQKNRQLKSSTPQRIRTSNLRFRSRFQDVAEKLKNYVLVATYNDVAVLQVVANRVKR